MLVFHEELKENVNLHLLKTDQFKDVTMQMKYMLPSDQATDALFLLNFILEDVCAKYPSKQKVADLFDSLYGASFEVGEKTRGLAEVIEFTCKTIDGSYVHVPDLWKKQLDVLHDFVFDPYFVDGEFEPQLFEEAKEKAISAVLMLLDDPNTYANQKALELYGGPFLKKALPDVENLKKVTNQEVVDAYNFLQQHAIVDFFVCGNLEIDELVQEINNKFAFRSRIGKRELYRNVSKESFEQMREQKELSTSSVVMLFETGLTYQMEEMPSMMLCNGIFGALPVSMLFQNIREKEGLCYTIESDHWIEDGILKVYFEASKNHLEEVYEDVLHELLDLQEGRFEEERLEITKRMYANSWQSSKDHAQSLINDVYRSLILGYEDSIEDKIEAFYRVSKQDIMERAKALKLKVVYCLEAEGEDEEEL